MNKSLESREQQLDNLLSEFTDQVLSNANEENVQETITQDELGKLQKTVLRMKAAAQKARVNENADKRIRNRLLVEWKKTSLTKQPAPKRFTWRWVFPRLAFAGGFAVLILISALTWATPSTVPLAGAAVESQSASPLFILIGIIIFVLLLWHNRHN